jgi:hypothetical protein
MMLDGFWIGLMNADVSDLNDMVLTALPFTRRLVDANTPFRIRNTSALKKSCGYLRTRTVFNRRLLRCIFVQDPQTAHADQRS